MSGLLNDSNFRIMQKSLDALWLRQKVISNNIANIDTPGYKSKRVEFENILNNQLTSLNNDQGTNNQLQSIEPQIIEDNKYIMREDGNNVDIDAQNIELVRTQIQYEYMTRMISNAISREKYAITEGR
ncbi:MAG TPA: flagellar basal body rod protein FlgB [Clostridia bacterium]|jgi:flagellar basal-body rod protein FlgB|nr:flagellar basal body rod protein FlgB [Clostridia bacterium]